MKKILFIISIIMCSETFAHGFNEPRYPVDTNLRYQNIINYIKKDLIIDRIIYKYYPPIKCFDFPDTTKFMKIGAEVYFLLNGDTSKKTNFILFKIEYSGILDSINKHRYDNYLRMKTNYKKEHDCDSIYKFGIEFFSDDIWVISIIPKKILPGLYMSISYVFLFDNYDTIIKTITDFAQ